MTRRARLPALIAFGTAGAVAFGAAALSVSEIERRSVEAVDTALESAGHGWSEVNADGLQLTLTGTAPDEATRFRALSIAAGIVDPSRVIDRMQVAEAEAIDAPDFSIEVLRNDEGISLIGLVPAATDRGALVDRIESLSDGAEVTDLLETADFPAPEGWDPAVDFGLEALRQLPRSKVSISPDAVSVTAIAEDRAAKTRLENSLSRAAPQEVSLTLDLSAPRPVITPFTLRFRIDGDGPRFDACSAETEEGRSRIRQAAAEAGMEGEIGCTLGLGRPTPDWSNAAAEAIAAVARLGAGTVTMSDADIALVAPPEIERDAFDREVGTLQAALPDAFSLDATLQEPAEEPDADTPDPTFVATRSPEGEVQMRGLVRDERASDAVESFAQARFGLETVTNALRLEPDLPDAWANRVLAAVDTLSLLDRGAATVERDEIVVSGTTGNADARAEIARLMTERLGGSAEFTVNVTYDETLDPALSAPTPEECVEQINAVLETRQITFAPGSATIDSEARESLDRIAELLKTCEDVRMEVAGHTDSQGREVMNEELSQSRAEAVLGALMARRVLVSNLTAKGYGETEPIADNSTASGREANRRIEFSLIAPEGGDASGEDDEDSGPEGAGGDDASGTETTDEGDAQ
ncbi:OmpA family protein [Tranquillimonas rosea]|uniref:OmpA family protein n=1 Tax=Tranquillimonas rosea TaxID=641238 RepID=UPI003BAC7A17